MNQPLVAPAVELYGSPDQAALVYRFGGPYILGSGVDADLLVPNLETGRAVLIYRTWPLLVSSTDANCLWRVRGDTHLEVTRGATLHTEDALRVGQGSTGTHLQVRAVSDGKIVLLLEQGRRLVHVLMDPAHSVSAVITEECAYRGVARSTKNVPWELEGRIAPGGDLEDFGDLLGHLFA